MTFLKVLCCLLLIDISLSASLKILDDIIVLVSTKKFDFLVFHLIQAFGKTLYFFKKLGRLSPGGSEVLAFGSHFSAKFQSHLDCFIPSFKLKCEDSENIKTDCVDTVLFNLHQIKQRNSFWDIRWCRF